MVGTNPFVTDKRGFHQGFDRFAMAKDDQAAVAKAAAWWAEDRLGPRLLVVHLIGPHLPYEPQVPPAGRGERIGDRFDDLDGIDDYGQVDRARIAALYAADVAQVDARVGELLDLVGAGAITAVVSDHGEELWEHGGYEHGHALWPEVVRVHAAIHVPGRAARRPRGPVRLQDVGQYLALAAGLPPDPAWSPPTDIVRLGYPSKRRPAVHTDGIVAPEGVLLRGTSRFVQGDEAALMARLAKADTVRWRGERTEQRWCELAVVAGESMTLPGNLEWRETEPPTAWGPAYRDKGSLVLTPLRSGTWTVLGVESETCRVERPEALRDFDDMERQGLRALGYVE
jgi:hypothetical protein